MNPIWQSPQDTHNRTREQPILVSTPDQLEQLNQFLIEGWIIRSRSSITPVNDGQALLVIIEDGGVPGSQVCMMVDANDDGVGQLNRALEVSGRTHFCSVAVGSRVLVVLEDQTELPGYMSRTTCIF